MPVVETRRNYNVNPRMVNSIAGWSVTSSGVTQTPTGSGTQIDFPNQISGNALFLYQTASPTAAAGEVWSGSIEISVPVGYPAVTLRLDTRGYTGGSSHSIGSSPNTVINPGETVRLAATSLPLVAGANGVRSWLNSAATITAGSRIIVRSAILEKSAIPGTYFDGTTAPHTSLDGAGYDTYSWVGAADASASVEIRQIRLTAFPDMAPVPRVLVDVPVSLFPAGSVTVSITRTCEGRTIDVPGGQRLSVASPAIVIDPEPGFKVRSSYTVTGYDATNQPVGSFPVGSVIVDFDGTVIQQPLDPNLAVLVDRLSSTANEIRRDAPGELVYPQAQELPSLVGLGPRRGVQGLRMDVRVRSAADADMLQATLGGYGGQARQLPIWLVRTPPGQRIPRILFCSVFSLVERDVSHFSVKVPFSAVVTEVRRPAAGITAAGLTYSDVGVFFSTYSALGAAYATYSDIRRDTSLIGAADVS
jgi:hypothetical protein